jgi:hypothetical protein
MMKVRVVRVGMLERLVAVPVAVRLAGWIIWAVLMPVVRVVNVPVRVLHRPVAVPVLVTLGEVQPDANGH